MKSQIGLTVTLCTPLTCGLCACGRIKGKMKNQTWPIPSLMRQLVLSGPTDDPERKAKHAKWVSVEWLFGRLK